MVDQEFKFLKFPLTVPCNLDQFLNVPILSHDKKKKKNVIHYGYADTVI